MKQQPSTYTVLLSIAVIVLAGASYSLSLSESSRVDQSAAAPQPTIKKWHPVKESTVSEVIEDEVVVKVKTPSSFQGKYHSIQKKDFLEQEGLRLAKSLTITLLGAHEKPVAIIALYPSLSTVRLRLPKEISPESAIEFLSKDREVASVSLDYKGTLHGHNLSPPNDYYWTTHWPTNQPAPLPALAYMWGLDVIGMKQAWQHFSQWGGLPRSYPIVAVIDTGIDYNHPELSSNTWSNTAECCWSPTGKPMPNGLDDDQNGYIDDFFGVNIVYEHTTALGFLSDCSVPPLKNPLDTDGHGTAVAGTIAAEGNNNNNSVLNSYTVGVTQAVRLMPIKTTCLHGSDISEKTYLTDAIAGVEYAVRMGAQVIVAPWGFTVARNNSNSSSIDDLRMAIQRGEQTTLYVASAGNSDLNIDNCATPLWPQTFRLPNIMVTAASTPSDTRWITRSHGAGDPPCQLEENLFFASNYGEESVDIAAPGADSPSYIWSVVANGSSTEIAAYGGTSAAAPHVAGCAAISQATYAMTHNNRFMKPVDIKLHLIMNAKKSTIPVKPYGGFPRRLNCGAAVSSLLPLPPHAPKNLNIH